jgi:hypothetical protein
MAGDLMYDYDAFGDNPLADADFVRRVRCGGCLYYGVPARTWQGGEDPVFALDVRCTGMCGDRNGWCMERWQSKRRLSEQ